MLDSSSRDALHHQQRRCAVDTRSSRTPLVACWTSLKTPVSTLSRNGLSESGCAYFSSGLWYLQLTGMAQLHRSDHHLRLFKPVEVVTTTCPQRPCRVFLQRTPEFHSFLRSVFCARILFLDGPYRAIAVHGLRNPDRHVLTALPRTRPSVSHPGLQTTPCLSARGS